MQNFKQCAEVGNEEQEEGGEESKKVDGGRWTVDGNITVYGLRSTVYL